MYNKNRTEETTLSGSNGGVPWVKGPVGLDGEKVIPGEGNRRQNHFWHLQGCFHIHIKAV